MRNRRGIEAVTVIISLVIALAVLMLAGNLIAGPAKGTIIPFFKNLPDFNLTKSLAEDIGLFRYRIAEQTVQYYTGTEWRDFQSYEFNKKRAESALLKEDFERVYFTEREGAVIQITETGGNKRYVRIDGPFSKPVKIGEMSFVNYISLNGGEYIFNADGKLYQRKDKTEEKIAGEILIDELKRIMISIPLGAGSVYEKSDSAVKGYLGKINREEISIRILEKNAVGMGDSWNAKINDGYEFVCDYHLMWDNVFSKIDGAVADLTKIGMVNIPCTLNYLNSDSAVLNIKVILKINAATKLIIGGEIKTLVKINEENYGLASDFSAQEITKSIEEWKDRILSKAAKFRYYDISDKKNPKLKANYFNITRVDNDLIVDLNKPVGGEENGVLETIVPAPAVASEKEYGFLETICFLKGVEEAGVNVEEVAAQAAAIGFVAGTPKAEEAIKATAAAFEKHINYLNSAPTALPKDGTVVESLKIIVGNEGPKMVPKLVEPVAGVTKIIGGNSYVISESGEIIGKIGSGMNVERISAETTNILRTSGFKVAESAVGGGVVTALKLVDDAKYVKTAAGKIVGPLEEAGILVKYRGALKFVSSNSEVFKYSAKIVGKLALVYDLACSMETFHKFSDMSSDAYTALSDAQSSALSFDINVGQYYIRTGKKIQTLQSELEKLDGEYVNYLLGGGEEIFGIKESIDKMKMFLKAAEGDNKALGIRYNRFMNNGENKVETTGFSAITNKINDDEEKRLYSHYQNINHQLGSSKSNKPGDINNEIKSMSDYFNEYINADIIEIDELEPFVSGLNEYSAWYSPIYSLDYLIRYGTDANNYKNYLYKDNIKTNWYFFPTSEIIGLGDEAVFSVKDYDLMLSISKRDQAVGKIEPSSDGTFEIVFSKTFFSDLVLLATKEEYDKATKEYELLNHAIIDATEIYVGGLNEN